MSLWKSTGTLMAGTLARYFAQQLLSILHAQDERNDSSDSTCFTLYLGTMYMTIYIYRHEIRIVNTIGVKTHRAA